VLGIESESVDPDAVGPGVPVAHVVTVRLTLAANPERASVSQSASTLAGKSHGLKPPWEQCVWLGTFPILVPHHLSRCRRVPLTHVDHRPTFSKEVPDDDHA
jgi:hypothetical protein